MKMDSVENTIGDFARLVADGHGPAGGSCAAAAGVLAAALGEYCARTAECFKLREGFALARQTLLHHCEQDAQAYAHWRAVRRLPADAPDRDAQIVDAARHVVELPLTMAAAGVDLLELCEDLAGSVRPLMWPDLATAVDLTWALVRTSVRNSAANAANVFPAADAADVRRRGAELLRRADELFRKLHP